MSFEQVSSTACDGVQCTDYFLEISSITIDDSLVLQRVDLLGGCGG
jgi:hypothetical protein